MAFLRKSTVKGTDYWRIVESRRVGGKVKQVTLENIGNSKKLAERVMGPGKGLSLKSYSCGDTRALMAIASRFGVAEVLNECLGRQERNGVDRGTSLLLAAIHRAVEPGSKMGFARWFGGTSLPRDLGIGPEAMTSQHFWDQMDGIGQDGLSRAEDTIASRMLGACGAGIDRLALDYTNYYTYIASSNDRNTLAKRGHNKQKRNDLRQYSLAVVTSKDVGIPLFSHVYGGSTNDKDAFRQYLGVLGQRMPGTGLNGVTLVFDAGGNTKDNLGSLPAHYISGFSLSSAKDLYGIPRSDYREIGLGPHSRVSAYRCSREIWGKERVCILTLSERLFEGQMRELDSAVSKAASSLDELIRRLGSPRSRTRREKGALEQRVGQILKKKHLKDIFAVEVADGHVGYCIDGQGKGRVAEKYFGKKLIVSDRADWSTAEIVGAYREQDRIEKIFRNSKDTGHFSMQPTYHWTDQKIRVHVFICLLGLSLATILHKEVTDRGCVLSKEAMIDELKGVREGWVTDTGIPDGGGAKGSGPVRRLIEDMSPQQSRLWDIVSGL